MSEETNDEQFQKDLAYLKRQDVDALFEAIRPVIMRHYHGHSDTACLELLRTIEAHYAQKLKENTILRGIIAKLPTPCVYCGKQTMSECPSGFPGCAMADDMMAADDEISRRLLDERRRLVDELKVLAVINDSNAASHWNQWARIAHEKFAAELRAILAKLSL